MRTWWVHACAGLSLRARRMPYYWYEAVQACLHAVCYSLGLLRARPGLVCCGIECAQCMPPDEDRRVCNCIESTNRLLRRERSPEGSSGDRVGVSQGCEERRCEVQDGLRTARRRRPEQSETCLRASETLRGLQLRTWLPVDASVLSASLSSACSTAMVSSSLPTGSLSTATSDMSPKMIGKRWG